MLENKKGPATYEPTNRLRRIRQERFWTLDELSEASGVHVQTLMRIEHGQVRPRALTVKRLAKALDVEPTELAKL